MRQFLMLLVTITLLTTASAAFGEVWKVSQAVAPGYADSEGKGPWVDFLRVLAREAGVKFDITMYPGRRSVMSVHKGESDMIIGVQLPLDRSALDQLNVKFSSFDLANVDFYLYTAKDINLKKLKELSVVAPPGTEKFFGSYVEGRKCIPCSLKMLIKGRIDAYLFTPSVVDRIIEEEKLEGISKQFYVSLPVKVMFRKDIPPDVEQRLEAAFRKAMKSNAIDALWDMSAFVRPPQE